MSDENILEKIEAYFNNEMSESERVDFENEITGDSTLADTVSSFEIARKSITAGAHAQLRQKVDEVFESKGKEKNGGRRINFQRIFSIAAALILLLGSLFFFDVFSDKMTSEEAYSAYYELPAAPTIRSGESENAEIWTKAVERYTNQDFNSVISLLSSNIDADIFSNKEEGRMILGISFLENDEPEKAVEQFEKISRISSLAGQADWYLAMIGLKYHDIENAKVRLKTIVEKGGFKNKEASLILERLE